MGPIDMPFDLFDYLGDLTKFRKFHRASPIGRGPTRRQSTRVDFVVSYAIVVIVFFLEIVYRWERARETTFLKGAIPLAHVAFCDFRATNS